MDSIFNFFIKLLVFLNLLIIFQYFIFSKTIPLSPVYHFFGNTSIYNILIFNIDHNCSYIYLFIVDFLKDAIFLFNQYYQRLSTFIKTFQRTHVRFIGPLHCMFLCKCIKSCSQYYLPFCGQVCFQLTLTLTVLAIEVPALPGRLPTHIFLKET